MPSIAFSQVQTSASAKYYQQLTDYHQGKIPENQLPRLSLMAVENHQDSIARIIAADYKKRKLEKGNIGSLLNPELKDYLMSFYTLFKLEDKLILYLLKNSEQADTKFAEKGFSKKVTDYMITQGQINPAIKPNGNFSTTTPDWRVLKTNLKNYVSEHDAEKFLVDAKLSWHNAREDWPNVVKYNIEKIEKFGMDTAGMGKSMINNMIFDVIFTHSDDPAALNKGLEYMRILLKSNPNADTWIDTYANLLYKAGNKAEAIKQEERALSLAKSRNDRTRVSEYE